MDEKNNYTAWHYCGYKITVHFKIDLCLPYLPTPPGKLFEELHNYSRIYKKYLNLPVLEN